MIKIYKKKINFQIIACIQCPLHRASGKKRFGFEIYSSKYINKIDSARGFKRVVSARA